MNDCERTLVALATARTLSESLSASLPSSLDPAMLTLRSKLPFKVLSLRELLLHRVSALAIAAVQQFEQHNYLGGIVLTRSVLETVAVAFALKRGLVRFRHTRNVEVLDGYVMRLLFASAAPDAKRSAMNVTGLVDAVDKRIPGLRETYNSFSEYVHPNWSGMFGSFGTIEQHTLILRLGMSEESAAWGVGVNSLVGLLAEFQEIYNGLPLLITELNSYFEDK